MRNIAKLEDETRDIECVVRQYADDDIEDIWPEIEGFVQKAMEYSQGEMTSDDVLNLVLRGLQQVFVCFMDGKVTAVVITEFKQYPQFKVVFMVGLAGRHFKLFFDNYGPTFFTWAEMNGAVSVEAGVRPAMQRFLRPLGFNAVYSIVRRKLEGGLQ